MSDQGFWFCANCQAITIHDEHICTRCGHHHNAGDTQ